MKRKFLKSLIIVFVGINMFLSLNIKASNQSDFSLAMLEAQANSNDETGELCVIDPIIDPFPNRVIPGDGFFADMVNSLFN
ncbi:hypothetical protein EYV94_11085 [Puteibacter caeruleilacunae]|nr:hypothetical protein EYV94_11085 [Puteibacter caeruleilacunae]